MSEYILETKNLGISFGGLKASQNVNLKIKEKQIYGLIGPNGAGKTTVFNMLTGVYLPTEGDFFLCGESLKGLHQEAINFQQYDGRPQRHGRTFKSARIQMLSF